VGDNSASIATTGFIGATSVRADLAQSFTELQQQQARQNIHAAPFDAEAYNGLQINGAMDISQERGASGATTSGTYIGDSWKLLFSGTMALGAFCGPAAIFVGLQNLLYVTVSTAEASLAAGDYAFINQTIEGYRIARLSFGSNNAQPITIGFWTAHQRVGVYGGSIRNVPATRTYAFSYAQNAAGIPQFNTVTIPGDITGTWATDNTGGLSITFTLASGSANIAPAANTWYAGNYITAPGQVNSIAATTDVFRISGVIVLPGNEAPSAARSPFIMRKVPEELVICQRYYSKSFNYGINPANAADAQQYTGLAWSTTSVSSQRIKLPAPMRAPPTITPYSSTQGTPTAGMWQLLTTAGAFLNPTSTSMASENFDAFNLGLAGFTGLTAGWAYVLYGNWTADARL
jgi:hypothetical protein